MSPELARLPTAFAIASDRSTIFQYLIFSFPSSFSTPLDICSIIFAGFSERGSSEVRMIRSAALAATCPINILLLGSLSPAAPKTQISLFLVIFLRVFKAFSIEFGVCAKSIKTLKSCPSITSCIRPSTPGKLSNALDKLLSSTPSNLPTVKAASIFNKLNSPINLVEMDNVFSCFCFVL